MKNAATEGIERDFPDWRVWLSRKGEYWGAVRRRPAPDLTPTIITDSERELRAALAEETANPARCGWAWPGEEPAGSAEETDAEAADVAGCLRAFADEFARYEGLQVRLMYRSGDAGALRVTPEDAPELSEELVCAEEDGLVEYLWRWGEPIEGEDLRAKAAAVARVLGVESLR